MAFSFTAGVTAKKRDEEEEQNRPVVNDATPGRTVNEGGRRIGDLPTVAPRRDDEDEPLVFDPGQPEAKRDEEETGTVPAVQSPEENGDSPMKGQSPEVPAVTETPEAPKTEAPKKQEENAPLVYAPQTSGGTSGGTDAAGTKAELTGIPEGSDTWTPEQWKEYMSNPGNREAMADVTRKTADAARAERNRERAERSGLERAERNAPQAPRTGNAGGQSHEGTAPAPVYAWQGFRPGDSLAALEMIPGYNAGGTGPAVQSPVPQREPRRSGEERAERNAPPAPRPNPVGTPEWLAENGLSWAIQPEPGPQQEAGNAPRRSGEERAERNAPRGSFQPKVGTQRWYEENGLSWAGQPNPGGTPMTMPDVTADYPGGGGYDAMFEDGVRIRMDRGESREEAEQNTVLDIVRQNLTAAGAGGRSPKVVRYEPNVKTEEEKAQEAEAQNILTATTAAGEKNAVQIAQENGVDQSVLTDPDFLKAFQGYRGQGYNVQAAFMTALAGYDAKVQDETRVLKNKYVDDAIEKSGVDPRDITPEQYDQIEAEAEARAEQDYTKQTGKRYQEPRRNGEERAEQGMSYNPPATSGGPSQKSESSATREDSSPRTSGEPSPTEPSPNRPGADAEVNSWDGNAAPREPDSVRFAREAAERRNKGTEGSGSGTGGTTNGKYDAGVEKGSGSGSGTGSGSGNGKGDVPKGSTYFVPSYGQDMEKGVKAPYRKEGYSAEEIEKMGNKARSDWKYYNGKKAYEGYYLAPNGKYYPVDQIKANYYRQNGSYAGWEEGMRDYWNTFGTFYGYRPGWKSTGRLGSGGGGGGGYSGGGYSYSGSRSPYSGRSGGGSGSATASNGLYWNGNTSWNIS